MTEVKLSPHLRRIDPQLAGGPHATDQKVIDTYAEALRQGAEFPPIRVVAIGDSYMIIDGHHRASAAKLVGCSVLALVVECERFEDLDTELRAAGEGKRADNLEFWA